MSEWKCCADELPDADTTVLAHHRKWDEPVWPCFLDGGTWRYADAIACKPPPSHWMHFPVPPAQ